MNSKIRIDFDFDAKEPVLQLFIDAQNGDLADQTLKHFSEQARQFGVRVGLPDSNKDNSVMQIRVDNPAFDNVKEKEADAVMRIEILRDKVKGWLGKEHEATDEIFNSIIAKVSVNILKNPL